jgi:hemerythrin-like domain-containing protein
MDMDALGLLREDHRRLEGLLERLEGADRSDLDGRAALVGQVRTAVRQHVDQEEGMLYPAFEARASGPNIDPDMLPRGREQHRLLRVLVDDLGGLPPADERVEAKLRLLVGRVRSHLDDEDTGLFAATEDLVPDEELLDLGRRLEDRKRVVAAQEEIREDLRQMIQPVTDPRNRRWLAAGAGAVAVGSIVALWAARRGRRRRRLRRG